jgi:hypothetical protein
MSTPSAFDGWDVIEGFDPVEKDQLIDQPFGITGVRFRQNDQKIVFAEVETVSADGNQAAFQDASTGVRDQLIKLLTERGVKDWANGEWHDIKLYVPRGLRVSKYEWVDKTDGKRKQAQTFYLTTAGRTHQP